MSSIECYYGDVLRGDFTKLYKRHEQFPTIVMTCAIDDYRYDVVDELIKHQVKVNYNPMFKFKWVQDKTALLGISPENLETGEELVRKFKMIDFLLQRGVVDEKIIPKHLIPNWREFKGIEIGSQKNYLLYFLLIILSLLSAMCISFVF